MDKATIAIIVSSLSAVIAGLSLGWNIYRDVILRPRLKVKFAVKRLFIRGLNNPSDGVDVLPKFISISVTNFGTRSTTIQAIRSKSIKEKELLVIDNLFDAEFPEKLEAGEKVKFELPYNKSYCEFLLGDCILIGLEDSFGKIHWVKRRDLKKAHKEWKEDLKRDKVPLGETTIHPIHH